MTRWRNPPFMNLIFTQKNYYQLRTKDVLCMLKIQCWKHSFDTFWFHTCQVWSQVLDSFKSASSARHFKTEMLKNRLVTNAHAMYLMREMQKKTNCNVVNTVDMKWARIMPSGNISSRLLCWQWVIFCLFVVFYF